jgi:cardiolipin synthase
VNTRRWPGGALAANLLTAVRVALLPPLVRAYLSHHYWVAFWLVFVAGISDGFDGWVARHAGGNSRFGQYFDPLADKLLLSTAFITLSVAGDLPWVVTILVFTRDIAILVSAVAVFTFTGFRDFRPTFVGKVNTVAELATVGATLLFRLDPAAFWLGLEHFGWYVVGVLAFASGAHYSLTCAARFHAARESGRPRASREIA